MSRTIRLSVALASLLSALAITASAADAVTWHNTGSTAFTATAGATTISLGGTNLACSSAIVTGTAGTSFVGPAWAAATGKATYSPCNLAGISVTATCTYTITANSWAAGVTSGNADVTCLSEVNPSGSIICVTHGPTAGTFTNPSGSTPARGTLTASSTVRVTNGASSCPLGTGLATLSEGTYTVTNGTPTTLGPVISRTA